MSNALLRSVEQEIATLRHELATDPRIVKIEALERLRVLYSGDVVSAPRVQVRTEYRHATGGTTRGRAMKPERAEALRLSKEYLASRPGRPIKTAEIYAALELQGHSLPGDNPANNLASLLIRSEGIKSHGRAGWTLETETPEAPDDLLIRSASEASNSSVPDQPEHPTVRPVDPVPGGGT